MFVVVLRNLSDLEQKVEIIIIAVKLSQPVLDSVNANPAMRGELDSNKIILLDLYLLSNQRQPIIPIMNRLAS